MSTWPAQRQMPAQAGRSSPGGGEAGSRLGSDEACRSRHDRSDTGSGLLEAALTRENLKQAFKRVRANKGASGVDGLDIDQTAQYLKTAWPVIREQLLSGTYRPSPVRRVTIPKPDGGERELGIPTRASYCTYFKGVWGLWWKSGGVGNPFSQSLVRVVIYRDRVRPARFSLCR
jgi:RNA-directed DNA polymerase